MNELNYLRKQGKIASCWSHDGRMFCVIHPGGRVKRIQSMDDIYDMRDQFAPRGDPPRYTASHTSAPTTDENRIPSSLNGIEGAVGGLDPELGNAPFN